MDKSVLTFKYMKIFVLQFKYLKIIVLKFKHMKYLLIFLKLLLLLSNSVSIYSHNATFVDALNFNYIN